MAKSIWFEGPNDDESEEGTPVFYEDEVDYEYDYDSYEEEEP